MNDEAALDKRIEEEEYAVKIWENAGKCICCYQQLQKEHRQLANWLKELRRLREKVRKEANDGR
jgi:acyl-coenzyme A synthetase/AMP-(fatty) acid ligase